MYIYSYIAIDANNQLIKNTLLATNRKNAFLIITENNLTPLKIKFKSFFSLDNKNIDYRIHFFHQLGTLTSSGINLVQSLKILLSNCHLPFWKSIINHAIQHIEKGESFAEYLKMYPRIFSSTVISLVVVAEKTGHYDENFRIISSMLEHNEKVAILIKKAIRYPITLCIFSGLLLLIMFLYVIPQFESIYDNFQHELPFLTKIMIGISNFIHNQLVIFLLFVPVSIILLLKLRKSGALYLNKITLHIPILKNLLNLHYLSLYFLTISSTYKVGLPLADCLRCTMQTINHARYKKDCENILALVLKGETLSNAMKETFLFPSLAIQLISIAEESGKIDYFTSYLFKYYSNHYISYTEKKIKNLEPILLVFISILIGVIMLAMYLPIFNLGNVVTGA